MRRGLLKDLANTPTQIACGWRLYGPDLGRLADLDGKAVEIDLLAGSCQVDGVVLDPPLGITEDVTVWLRARFDKDGVPEGTITRLTLTLKPRREPRGRLAVECSTRLESSRGHYESRDRAVWAPGDRQ